MATDVRKSKVKLAPCGRWTGPLSVLSVVGYVTSSVSSQPQICHWMAVQERKEAARWMEDWYQLVTMTTTIKCSEVLRLQTWSLQDVVIKSTALFVFVFPQTPFQPFAVMTVQLSPYPPSDAGSYHRSLSSPLLNTFIAFASIYHLGQYLTWLFVFDLMPNITLLFTFY